MDYHVGHNVGIYKDFSNMNTSTKGELSWIIYMMKVQTPSELKWQVQASLCVRLPCPPMAPCPPALRGYLAIHCCPLRARSVRMQLENTHTRVDLSEWKAGFS